MVILVDDDDHGDLQALVKDFSGGSRGGFLHRHGSSGEGFSHRHGGSREGFRHSGSRKGFRHFYFRNKDFRHHHSSEGFRHCHDGRGGRSVHHHGSSGGSSVHHHGSSGKGFVHRHSSRGEGEGSVHRHSIKGEGSLPFHGSSDRVSARNRNSPRQNSTNVTARVYPSAVLPVNLHLERNGDTMVDPETCGWRPFNRPPTNKIDAPTALNNHSVVPTSDRKESEKQEASPSSQSPRESQAALPSPLPFPISQKEGNVPREEDNTVPVRQEKRERAFISCVGGNNRKRPRSSAVRDYPAGCGKSPLLPSPSPSPSPSLSLSAVNEMKRSQDSKVLVGDPAVTNRTGGDGPAQLVQSGPEVSVEDCSKKIGNKYSTNHIGEDGPIELVRSAPQVAIKDCSTKHENQSMTNLTGKDAPVECVQSGPHLAGEISSKKLPSQIPAVASDLVHMYPQGNSHSITQVKEKEQEQGGAICPFEEPSVRWGAETQTADGSLKIKPRQNGQNGLVAGPSGSSAGWQSRGPVAKKSKVRYISEIPESSRSAGSMRAKDLVKSLSHKANSRVSYLSQISRSVDSMMLENPTKELCQEADDGVSARSLVKRTLHEFESIRKALVKSQDTSKRADLDAAGMLKKRGRCRNSGEKIVGEVPGVEVGDQFSFRIEMLIIGLHRQIQSGIDYIPGKRRTNGCHLATSIVASGGYEDDQDGGDTLIYSGQGGNNYNGNKRQASDQKLVRGNLAMSNCMKEKTPVRVIRGTSDPASPSSKLYTYDGLYDVVGFRFQSGAAGYGVYHFTLTRRPGQPEVGLSIVKFVGNLKKKGLARPNLLLEDISGGKERLPVCVVNEVDGETAPTYFIYIPNIKYPMWFSPVLPQGCDCVGGCFDERKCSCVYKNGGEFPYNEKGYIIQAKKVVYECGSSCRCSSSCHNRVSQKGLRYQLEVFKTKNRGWGVRSVNSIQPGGFICEYTGELLSDAEAEQKIESDEYLFDLGNKCKPWSDVSDSMDTNGSTAVVPVIEDVGYTIDAKDLGNVARFINHSCSPNLFAQNVLYDSDDLRFPHVMLFATESIPPMRELTYDYNYSIGQVRDANGNVKTKACYCGAQDCQGRLY